MASKYVDITEGQVLLFNPCPEFTVAELNKAIDHYDPRASESEQVFTTTLRYAFTGLTESGESRAKEIVLKPGERLKVMSSASTELRAEAQGQCLVIVKDESELPAASLKALSEFKSYLDERGEQQIRKYQSRNGLRDNEMESEKYKLIGYYRNAEKAKVIDNHRRDLQNAEVAKKRTAKE